MNQENFALGRKSNVGTTAVISLGAQSSNNGTHNPPVRISITRIIPTTLQQVQQQSQGNMLSSSGLNRIPLTSPIRQFSVNQKAGVNTVVLKKANQVGNGIQQQQFMNSEGFEKQCEIEDSASPGGFRQVSVHNQIGGNPLQKRSMHVIDIEDAGPIEQTQNVVASGVVSNDKSPIIIKPQTKFPPIGKLPAQSSQNTSNFKLQKLKIIDKEIRKNNANGIEQGLGIALSQNATFKILRQGFSGAGFSHAIKQQAQELNQSQLVDLEVKGENPIAYPFVRFKRNKNNKSKDFQGQFIYDTDSTQQKTLEHPNQLNYERHSVALLGEEANNEKMYEYLDNSADMNRSSSTPMLLKKDSKNKRLNQTKNNNTNDNQPDDLEQLEEGNANQRYDKIKLAGASKQIGQKQPIGPRGDESDRDNTQESRTLNNPLSSKKQSFTNTSFKGKQIQTKIIKKPVENETTNELSNKYKQYSYQAVLEGSASKKIPAEDDSNNNNQVTSSQISIGGNNVQGDADDESCDDTTKITSNNSAVVLVAKNKNQGEIVGAEFFKLSNIVNQSERTASVLKGIENNADKTPQPKRKNFHQKLQTAISNGYASTPQIKSANNLAELDTILNDSISKAFLNTKSTATKEPKNMNNTTNPSILSEAILPQNNDATNPTTNKQKKQKKKKKRNAIAVAVAPPKPNLPPPGKYDHLPQELQRISQYQDFIRAVNFSNNIDVVTQTKPQFKMYVGKGNNSFLVKSSVKQRWWLQLVSDKDKIDSCHITWTQLRVNEIIANLKPYTGTLNKLRKDISAVGQKAITNSTEETQNDLSTNIDNSPLMTSSLNNESSQFQGDNTNGVDSSDSDTEKFHSLTSRGNTQKSNSLNTSLSNIKPEPKKPQIFSASKERSITPGNKGIIIPSNQLKPQIITYNLNSRRLFNPQDFKSILDVQPSKDYDLRYFFSRPLAEQFAITKREFEVVEDPNSLKMHNHLENNWNLSNKKALFYNLRNYYNTIKVNPFDNIPLTFHIKNGMNDPEYARFLEHFKLKEEECNQKEKLRLEYKFSNDKQKQLLGSQMKKPRNIWIIKPGEITNRGTGITVLSEIDQITSLLSINEMHPNGKPKTYIVQKYLDNPLLYNKRKFDIRCYFLVTIVKGRLKGYWYQDGYVRTSCKEYNCKNLTNKMIHLTNDAVQKKCDDYGKYEPGNKLSYNDLQRYLDQNYVDQKINFMTIVYPRMKQLALDCIKSTFMKMDPQRREMTFEVFGLDYMIDEEFKTWLIEVNTNPCLELSSPLLARIIPSMIENAFRIAIDPIFGFPPHPDWSLSAKKTFIPDSIMDNSKFELVFDELFDGPALQALYEQYSAQRQDIIIEEEEEEEEEIEDEQ